MFISVWFPYRLYALCSTHTTSNFPIKSFRWGTLLSCHSTRSQLEQCLRRKNMASYVNSYFLTTCILPFVLPLYSPKPENILLPVNVQQSFALEMHYTKRLFYIFNKSIHGSTDAVLKLLFYQLQHRVILFHKTTS